VRIVIVAVGRVKDRALRALVDEYLGRLKRHVASDEIEIPDAPPAKLIPALTRATAEATVIALEIGGRSLSSPALAVELERWGSRGKGIVAFVVGGADGIPPAFSQSAHHRWSLSPLTFPHRLARLILVEQLYRAMTILRGEPYAH
jgi:23S rRNA (pseudouridine1915-N3)-methyltransferase